MARTWKDNASEFRDLDAGEGWPFAVLVSCSVENNRRGNPNFSSEQLGSGKVPALRFAEAAGASADRVLRYLEAWNKAAQAGIVTGASHLGPQDAHSVQLPDVPFKRFYT